MPVYYGTTKITPIVAGEKEVEVDKTTLTTLTVEPSTEDTVYTADENTGYDTVVVPAVDSSIDENIQAENIMEGVTILGVTGTATGGVDTDLVYTKEEIDAKVSEINETISEISVPTKTSELTNDSGYITEHQSLSGYATETYVDTAVNNLVNGAPDTLDTLKEISDAFTENKDIVDTLQSTIGDKANKTDIPTKLSQLENDSGYVSDDTLSNLNEALDNVLSDSTKGVFVVPEYTSTDTGKVLTAGESGLEWSTVQGGSNITKVSELENDAGYLTEHQSLTPLETRLTALEGQTIPTKTSELQNDSGYLTSHQDLSSYALKSELPSISGLASETYVNTAISNLVNSAPEELDTLKELADAIANNQSVEEALSASITSKANSADVYTKDETYTKDEVTSLISNGTSNFYTKEEVDNKVPNIVISDEEPTEPVEGMIWFKPVE